jgi:hypothetical protein
VSQNGWSYFTMPTCIAPGEYLLRVELLALHSAHQVGRVDDFYQHRFFNINTGRAPLDVADSQDEVLRRLRTGV